MSWLIKKGNKKYIYLKLKSSMKVSKFTKQAFEDVCSPFCFSRACLWIGHERNDVAQSQLGEKETHNLSATLKIAFIIIIFFQKCAQLCVFWLSPQGYVY